MPPPLDAILVTGASTGIGKACALDLAAHGYRVYAGVRREADAAILRSEGPVEPVMLDVTDANEIDAVAKRIETDLGEHGLFGVVNNAGIALSGPLEFLELDELRRQFEVNVVSVVAVTQAVLPAIRKRGGRIVIIGSDSGYAAAPMLGPYCASKFAIEGLTDSLRQELRPWGLEVSLIEPGAIATPIWEKSNKVADDLLERLPEPALALYGPIVSPLRDAMMARAAEAAPVRIVAEAVRHALTAKRPRTRYPVGRDAKIQRVLSKLLPDRARDALTARYLKLPRRA